MGTVAGIELPQGDPGAVEDAAASFAKVSADFGSTGQTAQRALSSVPGWQGIASINFRDRCGNYASAASAGKSACHQVATALRKYGHELEQAQTEVRSLQRQAQDCVDRIDAANARAASASGRENGAEQRLLHAGAAGPAGATAAASAQHDMAQAGADRRAAEQDAAAASGELDRLRRRAEQINEQIKMQGRVAAGTVNAAAGGLPRVDFPQAAAPAVAGHGGSGIDYWSDAVLAVRLFNTGSFMYGAYKYDQYTQMAASWLTAAGRSPLTDYAFSVAQSQFPTFNNGRFGGAAASLLQKMPGRAGAFGEFMGDASRATPFFTKVGIVGGGAGVVLGTYHTYQDLAQHKGGGQLAVDVTGTAFSAATVAFLVVPGVGPTVVIVAGAAWGLAEAYQHREAIWHATEKTGKFIWDTSAPGILWNNRDAIGGALDKGVDIAGSGLRTAESGLSKMGNVLNPAHW